MSKLPDTNSKAESSLSVPVLVTKTVWIKEIILLEQIEGDTGKAINKKVITIVDFEDQELETFIEILIK